MKTELLLVVSLATLAGCFTPAPIVRLTPDGPGMVWRDGRAIVARDRPGSYRAAVAFERAGAQASFRVEIENTGSDRLDVDPAQMAYVSCLGQKSCRPPAAVVDPERVLVMLDQAQSRERAAAANDATAGAVFMLLDATVAVGAAASGQHRQASQALDDSARVARDTDRRSARHEASLAGLQSARDRWAAMALRRTTLFPGQGAAGLVYVPVEPGAQRVWLNVRIAGQDNWFPFRQEVISAVTDYRPTRGPDTP